MRAARLYSLIPAAWALWVCGACEAWLDTLEPDPETVPLSAIIDLARVGPNLPLPADGVSTDTIIARLPKEATTRVIKFSTTLGSFELTGGQKTIDVRSQLEGSKLIARAILVSDTLPGTAVVRASVSEFSSYLQIRFIE